MYRVDLSNIQFWERILRYPAAMKLPFVFGMDFTARY